MRSVQFGFTIIELLTVITIIGILAAVILNALNDARQEGIDAKVRTEMDAISKRADIDSAQTFTYDTVCGSNGYATSSVIVELIASIETLASSTVKCNSNAGAYAASVALDNSYWCIDSTGVRREISNALTPGEVVCPP